MRSGAYHKPYAGHLILSSTSSDSTKRCISLQLSFTLLRRRLLDSFASVAACCIAFVDSVNCVSFITLDSRRVASSLPGTHTRTHARVDKHTDQKRLKPNITMLHWCSVAEQHGRQKPVNRRLLLCLKQLVPQLPNMPLTRLRLLLQSCILSMCCLGLSSSKRRSSTGGRADTRVQKCA